MGTNAGESKFTSATAKLPTLNPHAPCELELPGHTIIIHTHSIPSLHKI